MGNGSTPLMNLPFIQEGFIDSELSDTSENAVQNKVIKSELDKKQGKIDYILEFDGNDETQFLRMYVSTNYYDSDSELKHPIPELCFEGGAEDLIKPVVLDGLDLPIDFNDAANKEYVDTEIAKNKIVITTF